MKKLLFAVLMLCSLHTWAGEWIADADSQCQVWNLNPSSGESIKWSGKCLKGKASGKGSLQWYMNGSPTGRYEGDWRDGKHNGKGVLTWANGSRYEGEFRDSQKNGFGTFSLSKSANFTQGWVNKGQGQWIGEFYVVQGIFEENDKNVNLILACSSKANCKEVQARKEREDKAQAQREAERYRHLEKCEHIHDGKRFTQGKGFFTSTYEVIGFSSYTGKATVENIYNKNERFEMYCSSIPE